MDINKLDLFIAELEEFGTDEAEKAFNFFKEHWPQMEVDERKILSGVIVGMSLRFSESGANMKAKLYWLAIVNYSEKLVIDGKVVEDVDEGIFPRLRLGDGINGNQITKIFELLIRNGIITSPIDQVAEAISIIFPIAQSTAYNDLSERTRLELVKPPQPFN